jgi:uncharacterized membrane protein YphA (DoxX/SURF4 family)
MTELFSFSKPSNKKSRFAFSSWMDDSLQPSSQGWALYRIFYGLFVFFFMLPSQRMYAFLGDLSTDFFLPPPGPMMLFERFPPEWMLLMMHYLLIAALILLVAGFYTRWASLGVAVLLLLLKGFIYSVGKIDHDIILVVIPIFMAFSGWGKSYSVDAWRLNDDSKKDKQWALPVLALVIGFMMFTAGFPKILGGWLDVNTQASYGHFLTQYFGSGRQDLWAPYGFYIGEFWWEVADYATVIFEVGFLIAIINPKSTRVFISLAVFFHAGTMLFMNIAFLPNFIAYAAFLNWEWINKKIQNVAQKWGGDLQWSVLLLAVISISLIFAMLKLADVFYSGFQSDLELSSFLLIAASIPLAGYYLLSLTSILDR